MVRNANHSKQKWNIFIFLLSPIDTACSNMCHPDEDTYDSSSSSSLIAASNVFGDSMIASSMSSLSLSTFDKQVRENWRRARKLQKRNSHHDISLLDNSITEDGNENEYCEKLKKEEVATTTMKATSVRPPLSHPKQEKRKMKKKQKIHAPKTRSLLSLSRPPLSPPLKQEKKKNRLVLAREKMKYGKHRSTNTGKQQQKEILL